MKLASFVQYIENFTYAGVALLCLGAGYVIPIPVEVVLLIVGYLSASGVINIGIAMIVVIIALAAGDFIVFMAMRKGSSSIAKYIPHAKHHHHSKLDKYEHFLEKNIYKTLLFSRFLGVFRVMIPSIAATAKMHPAAFLFTNTSAVMFYAAFLISLGYHFHEAFVQVVTGVEVALHLLFFGVMAALGVVVVTVHRSYSKKYRRKLF